MSKGYDSRCWDLAKVFLEDEPALPEESDAERLAQAIPVIPRSRPS